MWRGLRSCPRSLDLPSVFFDTAGNLRYYEPDFVVLASDGTHYIVETKGLEDVNVANKKRAAELWCENTSTLTGKPWAYQHRQENAAASAERSQAVSC